MYGSLVIYINFPLIRFLHTFTVSFVQLLLQAVTTRFEYVAHGACCGAATNMLRQHAVACVIDTNLLRHGRCLEVLQRTAGI